MADEYNPLTTSPFQAGIIDQTPAPNAGDLTQPSDVVGLGAQAQPAPVTTAPLAPAAPQPAVSTLDVIRKFEGYRDRPYWDVNAHRVGYGSDTITRADGTIKRVEPTDVVTRDDAERDLARRVGEFQSGIVRSVGPEAWDRLPDNAKAALTSVAYNYGSLPSRVASAVRSGDVEAIATEVERLAGHNGGINAKRRKEEAALILDGSWTPGNNPTAPRTAAQWDAPPPVPLAPGYREAQAEAIRAENREQQATYWDAQKAAYSTGLTARLMRAAEDYKEEPDYRSPTDLINSVPKEYRHRLEDAVSPQMTARIMRSIESDIKHKQTIADAGGAGVAAQIIEAFTDPVSLGVAVGTGAISSAIVGAARLGRGAALATNAAGGAAGNLAIDSLDSVSGGEVTTGHLLASALMGASIGAMFGPMGRNPATQDLSERFGGYIAQNIDELRNGTSLSSSVGAAVNKAPFDETLGDAAARALRNDEVAMGKAGWGRVSAGGITATSENPIVRLLGGIGVDVLEKQGAHVNEFSAGERVSRDFKAKWSEWANHHNVGFRAWQKEIGDDGWWAKTVNRGLPEYNEQIVQYVTERDPVKAAKYSQAVRNAGEAFRRNKAAMADALRESGIPGAETLLPDPHYVPRIWSTYKINEAVVKHGRQRVEDAVAASIVDVHPQMDPELASKMARAIIHKPREKAVSLEEPFTHVNRLPPDEARRFIRDEFGLSSDEADRLIETLKVDMPEAAKIGNLKRRVDLNENYIWPGSNVDGTGAIAISDLLERDADKLLYTYNRTMLGRIALAKHKVTNPTTGEVIVDGFKTDADFDRAAALAKKWALDNLDADGQARTVKELEHARWMYDRIKGVPDPAQLNEAASYMRLLRTFNTSRLMGQLGINQAMDHGRFIGEFGFRSYFQNIAPFRRIVTSDGAYMMKHGLDQEIEAIMGTGADGLKHVAAALEEASRMGSRVTTLDKLQNAADRAAHVTNIVSGAHWMNTQGEMMVARMIAAKFAKMAADPEALTPAAIKQMRGLGLSEEMLGRVLKSVQSHANVENGFLTGKKVQRLNLDKWADQEARHHFENALYRYTSRMMQFNDIGAMHRWVSHPMAQTILQFRMYNIHAYENQMLRGIVEHDQREFTKMAWALMTSGLVYYVQSHIQAVGRSDARDFLEKRGLGENGKFEDFVKGTIGKTGFVSVLPMAIDTALLATPYEPWFGNSRASGQPSDIFNNPTTGLVNSAIKASKGLTSAFVEGRQMTQQEMRQVQQLLLFQNTIPVTNLFSATISNRPEK